MNVSWNWLREYVLLDMPIAEFERRLMMAGLNHESTKRVGDDAVIDLEVTSNRPDCLGHIGIAREAAVLFDRELKQPPAAPRESSGRAADKIAVSIECPDLCPRYTARVIRGVQVGPSPAWLVERLEAVGVASINNVVDVTNYVLMECGQPLHAFDLARLSGGKIIVREARAGEKIEAIDHRTYELAAGDCVIADARSPVAIGGVMGGAGSEVGAATVDLVIEAAEFAPRAIRATARRLALHSDSSYRFERGVDPAGVDWASRRACELILEFAGGELLAGVVAAGREPPARTPITLRVAQIERILGIQVDPAEARRILAVLGNEILAADAERIEVAPPSWRRDLAREIDLVEEVARIHGYEAIPEDTRVPMAKSARRPVDIALDRARHALLACGFDEAMTLSAVDEDLSASFSPWTAAEPLVARTPILRRADRLRRSLIPSLLAARRTNETLSNPVIELFEIAKVYLPRPSGLPDEPLLLGLTSGGEFLDVKGALETLLAALAPQARFDVAPLKNALLDAERSCELRLSGRTVGVLGEVSPTGLKRFELRGRATVAELWVDALAQTADLVPQYAPLPTQPAIARDLNLVVLERVTWADMEAAVRSSGGELLEAVEYRDTYRDADRLGAGRKSLLFSITLRARETTLTGQQADEVRDAIVAACAKQLGAELRA